MMRQRADRPTRRHSLALLAGGAVSLRLAGPAMAKAMLGEDGLYQMGWYLESFLDLADDIAGATAKGKRFAIMWGLKGCPACKRMHTVHMLDPAIETYVRDNFEILHLNIIGAREVTDVDGRRRGEKAFGDSCGIRATPTIQFFPETTTGRTAARAPALEVARMTGLPEPQEFLAMFRYVREKGYEQSPFPDWLKRQA